MELITDKNFVTTTDEIAGYKIVKHLGLVVEKDTPVIFGNKEYDANLDKMCEALLVKAKSRGGNAVVKAVFIPAVGVSPGVLLVYGTAVSIEPISK